MMKFCRLVSKPMLVLLLAATAASAHAAATRDLLQRPYTWRNVTITAGGYVPGIVFSKLEPNLIYARTDMGGAYRWDQSKRSWTPLLDWAGGADANLLGVESIVPDPVDKNKLYIEVGTYTSDWSDNGAVLRSTNQGRTFLRTNLPFKVGGNENGRSMGDRLAVDPNKTNILFLGSRKAGLWQSSDSAETWSKVASFPVADDSSGTGISFVVFNGATGSRGTASNDIYVGATNSPTPIYHSADGGKTWLAVTGQPAGLMPQQCKVDKRGVLYITYTNSPGPNDITNGAVWKFDTASGNWTDITPVHPGQNGAAGFGYSGICLDSQHIGTVVVGTLDRWNPGDDIFRSTDDGATWHGLRDDSVRDISASPWITFGKTASGFGWWLSGIAIDPFHPEHLLYGTGATIWSSWDAATTASGQPVHWTVGAQGVEETAVLSLVSPTVGPHLISGVGDIGGFRHDDLGISPPGGMFTNPTFTNTDSLAIAGSAPDVVVRTGRGGGPVGSAAYSNDSGSTWTPITSPVTGRRFGGSIAVSADGSTLIMAGNYSTDKGVTWQPCEGLSGRLAVIGDQVDPATFYAFGSSTGSLLVSKDGGAHFSLQSTTPVQGDARLALAPGHTGDLWISARTQGLYHSTDAGLTFTKIAGVGDVEALGFGMSAPGSSYPAIYVSGRTGQENGIFRSVDGGATWTRINDSQHQYGLTSNVIAGDPRVFGRVYVGTNGRGILVGDVDRAGKEM